MAINKKKIRVTENKKLDSNNSAGKNKKAKIMNKIKVAYSLIKSIAIEANSFSISTE